MNTNNLTAICTPIIGTVVQLNKTMISAGCRAYKIIQHNYIDDMLKKGNLLFMYAFRQVRGLDYYKRACELCYEIQSQAYFVHELGGFHTKDASIIDRLCDEILEQLSACQNHKLKDEVR